MAIIVLIQQVRYCNIYMYMYVTICIDILQTLEVCIEI